MPKEPIILLTGARITVELAIRTNGTSESKTYIEGLATSEKAKIISIIKRFADFGTIHNKKKFKKVEGKIFEFKDYQTRVLMFHCGKNHIALTHGFTKKKDKIPRKEIDKANQIMAEYIQIREGMTK